MDANARKAERPGSWSGRTPGLESLRNLQLAVLLQGLIDELGLVHAAQKLGVDRKTLWKCRKTGKLTPRLCAALEGLLLGGELSEAMRQGERVEEIESRLGELEQGLDSRLDAAVTGEVQAQEEGRSEVMRGLERRLVRLESAAGSESTAKEDTDPEAGRKVRLAAKGDAPFRPYPELVTLEAELGEELVYGDAMEVIAVWREARIAYARSVEVGSALSRAVAREHALVLELELIEEHELTLPPADYPWDWADRAAQALRRRRALWEARSERIGAERRRWLRRILSFGLWRD